MADTTVREDVANAFAGTSGADDEETTSDAPDAQSGEGTTAVSGEKALGSGNTPQADSESSAAASKEARARDGKGRFQKGGEQQPGEKAEPEAKTVKPATAAQKPGEKDAAAAQPKPGEKPADSAAQVKAPARLRVPPEKWAATPPEVQREVIRREREVSMAVQQAAEHQKRYQPYAEIFGPLEPTIRSLGGDPVGAIRDIARSTLVLYGPNPQLKARALAQAIHAFNVPPEDVANELNAIAGGAGSPQQPQRPAEMRDPRVDSWIAKQEQDQVQRVQQLVQQKDSELEDFSQSHDFMDDAEDTRVPDRMSELMINAAQRGQHMDFSDAWEQAVWSFPDLRKVMLQREESKAAQESQREAQKARASGSSIRSNPTVTVNQSEDEMDLRSMLRHQMNAGNAR